jgi:hypothetical protein
MTERFTNARVHLHLDTALDVVSEQMHTSRLTLNSAALWWFLNKLTPAERAEVLGEYVKVLAMVGQPETGGPGSVATEQGKGTKGRSKRKK